ncbi:His-Xaa-Ser system protein HxsD [Tamlana sp. s12]|uniref:His-Xaa-Ser system protein HxsD n=1 Tax=Tamlana sp. s12 TaxID=1630406 RepID=UPI0009ED35B8|nr:His-Xaa-Ser system protein HxsD [Tamlana sp. s12]QQY82903.1 His-Xaa-Ser system protein HxsD [Tamlana sp. s12]
MSTIELKLSSKIYSKEGISKCLYWYSDDYDISMDYREDYFFIKITSVNKELDDNFKKVLNKDLLDFNLRQIVKNETTPIRELIIAKAFSNGEYDEEPKGDMMDPLGIKFI